VNSAEALLVIGCLLLIVTGCSFVRKLGARHPGWEMQSACAALADAGFEPKLDMNGVRCNMVGYVRADGRSYKEKSPLNIGSMHYVARGKEGRADSLKLTMDEDIGKSSARLEHFIKHSETIFQKAFKMPMPDDMKNTLLNLRTLPFDTKQGNAYKPFVFTVKDAKVSLHGDTFYTMEIER
jgi:hypothetical protein